MKKTFRINLAVMLILTMIIGTTILSSGKDAISISKWLVESRLLENADLSIEEDITFNFSSKYNGVFREIMMFCS